VSIGRIPDGIGSVSTLPYATPGYSNTTPVHIKELKQNNIRLFPNPFVYGINITYDNEQFDCIIIKVYDLAGRQICEHVEKSNSGIIYLNKDNLHIFSGIYLMQMDAYSGNTLKQSFNNMIIAKEQ
jgi:hypothetical protein